MRIFRSANYSDTDIHIQSTKLFCQREESFGGVLNFKRPHDYFLFLTQHDNGASAVGNIDSD